MSKRIHEANNWEKAVTTAYVFEQGMAGFNWSHLSSDEIYQKRMESGRKMLEEEDDQEKKSNSKRKAKSQK
ncbi:hypothetical protein FDP41_004336 [Naegleria fowleri]|uniref:Uncharacterized protein n=1 Tax=Naegleria fowleri TaxID=5763 RepID=A0A6A5BHP7_NAEFO|nr:uncharacterized protein FDP41_004336 [Naegleria fowleri]KAF0976437.1 hypothetical protein FDP41_004336 [Naegleria fowleri]